MTDPSMALVESLRNLGMDLDRSHLRDAIRVLTQMLIDAEAEEHIGAGHYERTAHRRRHRYGCRERSWQTRAQVNGWIVWEAGTIATPTGGGNPLSLPDLGASDDHLGLWSCLEAHHCLGAITPSSWADAFAVCACIDDHAFAGPHHFGGAPNGAEGLLHRAWIVITGIRTTLRHIARLANHKRPFIGAGRDPIGQEIKSMRVHEWTSLFVLWHQSPVSSLAGASGANGDGVPDRLPHPGLAQASPSPFFALPCSSISSAITSFLL